MLDPATELRDGDQLRFVVRASAPRYLVLRARDGAGRDRLLFPAPDATTAAPVQPDQTLPGVLPIDATPGKETVTALFSEHAFPVGAPPERRRPGRDGRAEESALNPRGVNSRADRARIRSKLPSERSNRLGQREGGIQAPRRRDRAKDLDQRAADARSLIGR